MIKISNTLFTFKRVCQFKLPKSGRCCEINVYGQKSAIAACLIFKFAAILSFLSILKLY